MTSINIIAKPDVLWLFGDGASYDMDGVLVAITGKAYVISHLSTALLFSGRTICGPYVAHHLATLASDFDDLQRKIAEKLPGLVDHLTELYGEDEKYPDAGQGFRLFVGGWSASKARPAIFQICTSASDYRGSEIAAYTVFESNGLMMPGLSDEQRALGFGGPPLVNADTIANVAITTLELQRQGQAAGGETVSVGGLVELVEIRRDRIETRILHRWAADRVGELMQAAAIDWEQWRRDYPVNDPIAGMSRLQRDTYLRKQAKKLRKAS